MYQNVSITARLGNSHTYIVTPMLCNLPRTSIADKLLLKDFFVVFSCEKFDTLFLRHHRHRFYLGPSIKHVDRFWYFLALLLQRP